LDDNLLAETADLSKQCSVLWRRALETACNKPSPLSFHAALTLMGPVVTGRGTKETVEYLQALNTELDLRISAGVPAIKNEAHRIYWDGMPVWSRLADLHRMFSDLNTVIVASTYCNSWIFEDLDAAHPIDSMARAYTKLFIVRSDEAKEQYIKSMVDKFQIDGIVFHEAKTCPYNSNARFGMPDRLYRDLHIPVTTLYGDHVDPGMFDTERAALQIEAFVERLNGGAG
jgi:benzoyl-CoA reductase/2-hydroxyglutaryl-CoA dehydratase subunit BcrC/BadD/HgdB